ncbi:CYTH domain-containing protein [Nonlabens tegetincola]|uniref:CYTH domain-containing protein n=1 Tax=Nonlabens tegetincola TaxID=323273 RepID=UPI000CF459FE|nr:CYTH domain-containing protein [Nonlabens tegetincola]PQJ20394.1 adenylate cyclase [Nonlabens tegetincola]
MINEEIERKFLVSNTEFLKEYQGVQLIQGYLTTDPCRTVRVRIQENGGYLTIKGPSTDDGLKRLEWEKEISISEAEALLELCLPMPIHKIRYKIPIGTHFFEVDLFQKENAGLIIAEIELNSELDEFDAPEWLGEEVTGNNKYYNSYISKNPFSTW